MSFNSTVQFVPLSSPILFETYKINSFPHLRQNKRRLFGLQINELVETSLLPNQEQVPFFADLSVWGVEGVDLRPA